MLWVQKCSAPPITTLLLDFWRLNLSPQSFILILNFVPVVEVPAKLPGPLGKFQLQQWKHRETFVRVSSAVFFFFFGPGQVGNG